MNRPCEWLLYCRAGFEADLAAEIADRAALIGEEGEVAAAAPNSGFVRWRTADDEPANAIHRALPLGGLVFARQSLVAFAPLSLDREDRLSAIAALVEASGWSFESVWHETPDTNEGKSLGRLAKSLSRPLESALKRAGALRRKAGGRRLHLYWLAGDEVQVGISFPGNRSEHPGGVLRLRHPHDAPSRSTLKLEEAWHTFIPRDAWPLRLSDGMQAVDLGAAPGGWTYQLVRKGMFVYAIDNGPMDKGLMATGQVEHLKEDGFVWEPPYRLDWLVCDIVDKPMRVIDMVERWLVKRWCREAVFNLKLPMKRRWQEVSRCLARLEQTLAANDVSAHIACRHLYHDREEVTVHVQLDV
ncbi:23S rRNA (cytidine(2498)-2'-O)-methyltransferase RlmM [Salinicola rhizosphaerae]|uniref:Ribosomal RNA large subunit methyltransferase M n=1 Tax=Salinicola rhizosphaerae TaxID=1443141 RepID=A0ABQ3DMP3_9GAMM|nr:23S rRNA (cytidine(2498)-2'-O)-methyltransferase RlmM [Salinicola rhizosphaerae]GHB07032.1 ribosomal RNA large subunit methyltransferase M [Salinicola rhizosphaerae]